ncbi:MAG: Zn-ribbon domain-containing OB-fold protein [bacterium]
MSSQQIPIHEGLFTWPSESPSLLGSRCNSCGEHFFPVQRGCSNCSGTDLETVELGSRGTLWTWTIQGFMPKSPYASDETPETFTPYGVGYVEMPSGVKVEARLKENTPDKLRIGMPMDLVIEKLRTDDNGNEIMNFAFRAAEQE